MSGRIPASLAVDLADSLVSSLDPDRLLVGIASDVNIDVNGLSPEWDLLYDLPRRASQLIVRISPLEGHLDDSPLGVRLRETPFLREYEDEAFVHKVAREIGLSWEEWQAKRVELALAERHPALPVPFVDSPRAVEKLAEAGIDFVSGPTDIALSTKRHKDGKIMWEAQAGGKKRETPFNDEDDGPKPAS